MKIMKTVAPTLGLPGSTQKSYLSKARHVVCFSDLGSRTSGATALEPNPNRFPTLGHKASGLPHFNTSTPGHVNGAGRLSKRLPVTPVLVFDAAPSRSSAWCSTLPGRLRSEWNLPAHLQVNRKNVGIPKSWIPDGSPQALAWPPHNPGIESQSTTDLCTEGPPVQPLAVFLL